MNWQQQSQDRKLQNSNYDLHPHKQINIQVSSSQAQPFIQDYKIEVIFKNSVALIRYAIFIYVLFVGLELLEFNTESNQLSGYEKSYLLDLQMYTSALASSKLSKINMFVDMYREIMLLNFSSNTNQNVTCNQSRYYCSNSSYSQVSNIIEDKYDIILQNYKSLIQIENQTDDGQLFLYYSKYNNPLLVYNFNGNLKLDIITQLLPYIEAYKENGYFSKIIKVLNPEHDSVKLLFCGEVPAFGSLSKICVLTPGCFQEQIRTKNNPIRIIDQNMLTIFDNKVSENIFTQTQQQAMIAQEIVANSVLPSDQSFFKSFYLQECVEQYAKIEFMVKNRVKICNPPQLMYFISPLTIFTNFGISINPRYYVEDLSSATKIESISINFALFSNKTFFQDESERIKYFNMKQSIAIQIVVGFIVLWLLLMPFMPLKLIGSQLAQTVSILIKMCKAVKMIKNKDDLEQQNDLFLKLNNEMMKKTHIFYSTIEYFKYFIWYRKWLCTTNTSKKKALLEQGLDLFGSSEYAPVLMFIYKKQIERDEKSVSNYRRMRKIFTERFVIFQNDERTEGSINSVRARINAAKNKKKSLFTKEQQSESDKLEAQDYCIIQHMERNFENRINKQLQLMEIQKKNKRYVRFSNDLQQEQKHPFQYRVSKFLLQPSQPSILKSSQKSIQQQVRKKQKEDEQIGSLQGVESSREQKIASDAKDQSEFSSKYEQNWNYYLKFDQLDQSNSMDYDQAQYYEMKKFSLPKLDQKLTHLYSHLVSSYNAMIGIKKSYMDKQTHTEIIDYVNQLYHMEIQRLRYTYKYVKHRLKEKDIILQELSRKLIILKKERSMKDIDSSKKSKPNQSQKMLQQTMSSIEQEIMDEVKSVDCQLRNFTELEQKHKIKHLLIEKARIYQIKLLKILRKPIPYKILEDLCESMNDQIRLQAKVIMATEYFQISPHADYEVLIKAQENLLETHTTHSQKRKSLKLIKKVLSNRQIMEEYQSQIELIKNYYNYVQKKFYFIADFSDNYEPFIPILAQIYKNMGQVDMFQILNLSMNEIIQDMIVCGNQMKPLKFADFEIRFENLYNELTKNRSLATLPRGNTNNKDNNSSNSNHTINQNPNSGNIKRIVVEKDFNKILSKIQKQDINLSKFIVLILGGENQVHSKTHEDYQSISAQNRQAHQFVHQQILSKMDNNYFHVILVGYNLKDYQTREGKIKKYAKHSHDLFEIDLSKQEIQSQIKELHKFLNK